MIVQTVRKKAGSFTADQWITGASGFTDPDPNVTPPSASRIISIPKRFRLYNDSINGIGATPQSGRASPQLSVFMADGTSASVAAWWYDDGQALWIRNADPLPLTFATFNAAFAVAQVGTTPGRRFFVQVASNTGATMFAVVIR